MRHSFQLTLLAASALTLAACDSTGSRFDGIVATVNAVPVGTTAHDHDPASRARVEAKHGGDSFVTFYRADGLKIDLQQGLISLAPIELTRCQTLSTSLTRWLDQISPLASAQAHAGHDDPTPEGAINVVTDHDTDLGTLRPQPGDYCGINIMLRALPDTAHDDDAAPHSARASAKHGGIDHSSGGDPGTPTVRLSPCYYPSTIGMTSEEAASVTEHHCIDVEVELPVHDIQRAFTPFPEGAVTLDADNTDLAVTLGVQYEDWFNGVDFEQLSTENPNARAQLASNIVESIQVWTDRR
ncbi:hypothetical protein [Sinimarinibacterium sp. NLF-5-8]|uniref:hypothetical protein n=1 Tax=Sinimarinibacterium sp. NLF-5-8 TaxID=2698684 RepID=UPI00137BC6E9|nr:hypothetical protein [Sinimarinibacterium sp. NLF-5-8]QHS11019.1 hypothetical protein GT972_13275 [Sinimarinibacterium sp. NLF-5-8]